MGIIYRPGWCGPGGGISMNKTRYTQKISYTQVGDDDDDDFKFNTLLAFGLTRPLIYNFFFWNRARSPGVH